MDSRSLGSCLYVQRGCGRKAELPANMQINLGRTTMRTIKIMKIIIQVHLERRLVKEHWRRYDRQSQVLIQHRIIIIIS